MENKQMIVTLIIENQLLPCINCFKTFIPASNVKIEACEHFQKMSFRNRYMVASATGAVSLTVPLKSGREQKTLVTEVEIDYSQNWQRQHWRTVTSCYHKSPFFDYYAEGFRDQLFSGLPLLFDFNLSMLRWLLKVLKIEKEFSFTSNFEKSYEQREVLDARDYWLPKNYTASAEGHVVKYPQVFEDRVGFLPNLSVLDLLMNEGPNATNILLSNF